jgi:hypothetical protein
MKKSLEKKVKILFTLKNGKKSNPFLPLKIERFEKK